MLVEQIVKNLAKVTPLTGGGNSQIFKVETHDKEVSVYKFIDISDLSSELFFFQKLTEANLPTIKILSHGSIDTYGYYQMELIENTITLNNIDLALKIADQLASLHSIKGNGFGRVIQLQDGIYFGEHTSLYSFIENKLNEISDDLKNFKNNDVSESLKQLTKDFKRIFIDITESCLVLGDAALPNALVGNNGEVLLIDPGPTRFATREWEFAYFERRYLSIDKERQSISENFAKAYLNKYSNIDMNKVAFFRVLITLGKLSWSIKKQPGNLNGPLDQFITSWRLY